MADTQRLGGREMHRLDKLMDKTFPIWNLVHRNCSYIMVCPTYAEAAQMKLFSREPPRLVARHSSFFNSDDILYLAAYSRVGKCTGKSVPIH